MIYQWRSTEAITSMLLSRGVCSQRRGLGLLNQMPQKQVQHSTRFRLCISHTVVLCLMSLCLLTLLWTEPAWALPAFPGAEGYGTDTIGGRGGRVIYVTNLNDSGTGSLRAALTATGPRIVMFKVGGTITLKDTIRMKKEANSFVTVAGQSAPGDGIQVKGHPIQMSDGIHDVIFRYMRVRIDPSHFQRDGGKGAGIIIYGNQDQQVYNIIIDHSSIQWSMDESLQAYARFDDVTFSYNLIGEGAHGIHVAPSSFDRAKISVHHNVLAHNEIRSPAFAHADHKIQTSPPALTADMRNNIIYNWENNNPSRFVNGVAINMVNNHYKAGPDSNPNYVGYFTAAAQVYMKGNLGPNCPTGCNNEWDLGFFDYTNSVYVPQAIEAKYRVYSAFNTLSVTTSAASTLMNDLLPTVGASLPKRDALDIRIINEVKNGTGGVGKGSDWPTLSGGTAPLDTDGDGMPDHWENTHSLDSNDASDGSKVQGGPGYTNVEVYINFLARDVTPPTADITRPAPPRQVTVK